MGDQSLTSQPMFHDLDERFSRQDEWSYPKSISILGWRDEAADTLWGYSERYLLASKEVCELINTNKVQDYVLTYPVLFLVRHAIELALKAVIQTRGGKFKRQHGLELLLSDIPDLPAWVKGWILEIDQIDATSMGLRYPDAEVSGIEIGCELDDFVAKIDLMFEALLAAYQSDGKSGVLP